MISTVSTSAWSCSLATCASCGGCVTFPSPNTYVMRCTPAVTSSKSRRRPASIWLTTSSPQRAGGAPRDFGDSFTVLQEQGLIGDALAGRLRSLAGLRTRLVHVYDEIDDARVHEALAAVLPDLDAFATALARLVS